MDSEKKIKPRSHASRLASFATMGGALLPIAQRMVDEVKLNDELCNAITHLLSSGEDSELAALRQALADPKLTKVVVKHLRLCLGVETSRRAGG